MTLTLQQRIENTRAAIASQERTVSTTRDSYHRDTEAARLRSYKSTLAGLECQQKQEAGQ